MRLRFHCPCEVCPSCGQRQYRDDHPADGLAYCHNPVHPGYEWWAHAGPHPPRCAQNPSEVAAMKAYDDAVLAANP